MDNNVASGLDEGLNLKRYFQILFLHKWLALFLVLAVSSIVVLYSFLSQDKYKTSFFLYHDISNQEIVSLEAESFYSQLESGYWTRVMHSKKLIDLVKDYCPVTSSSGYSFAVNGSAEDNMYEILLELDNRDDINTLVDAYLKALNTVDVINKREAFLGKIRYSQTQIQYNTNLIDSLDVEIYKLSRQLNIENIESTDHLRRINENYQEELKKAEVELSYITATRTNTEYELVNLHDTLFDNSSFTEPLKVQLMNLHVDHAKASTKYGIEHPVVKGIAGNIERIEEMLIQGEGGESVEIKTIRANPIKRSLMGQLIDLKIKETSLSAKIASIQQIVDNTDARNLSYSTQNLYQLLRERERVLAANDFLLKKSIDLEMSMNGISESFRLVDSPRIPLAPDKMDFRMMLLVGLLLGVALVFGLIYIYDYIDNRVKLVSDYENFFSLLPVLGVVKSFKSNKNNDLNSIDEKTLRDLKQDFIELSMNIKELVQKNNSNVVSICSPSRKDGKSFLVNLMSREYASIGKKVVVVDCDFYMPRLSNIFSSHEKIGISDFLLQNAKYESIVHKTEVENIHIVPIGHNIDNKTLPFDKGIVDDLLQDLRKQYDIVLVDTPALLAAPQMYDLIRKVDINLMAIRLWHTPRRNIEQLISKCNQFGVKLSGTIISGVKPLPIGNYYEKYGYNSYPEYKQEK